MKTQLKRLRKSAGYQTQEDFAKAFNVPVRRYASWERGEVELSLSVALQLTDFLNCTLDEFVGREAPPPRYSDQRQGALNACYENMNEEGRETLARVARSLEYDIENRVSKNREGTPPYSSQLAG